MKPLVFILFLFAFTCSCMAQKEWELRLGAGYHLSTASQYIVEQLSATSTTSQSRSVNASFGRGPGINADLTHWINRYFGFTAGGSYRTLAPSVDGYQNYGGPDNSYSATTTWHSRIALASAGIALKVPDTKLHPYARMGLLIPVYAHVTEDADWRYISFGGSSSGQSKRTFRLRPTAGYTAAIGIAPKLDKHLSLFAEINLQSLAALARRSTLTSIIQNGVEKIDSYTTSARETRYVKKLDPNYPYNSNDPDEQLTFSFPYSSIGIHIGVSFKL